MQIYRPQSVLTFGVVVLMATLVRGVQLDSTTESGRSGETLKPPGNEAQEQRLDKVFESFAPAVEKVSPAVVRIVTTLRFDSPPDLANGGQDALRRYLFGRMAQGGSRQPMERGLGSGVIVTEDGYILTNGHLVTGANELEVTLQDERQFNAKVIGLDHESDIAVIKIDAHNLPTVPLADSRKVQVGDLVLAIGHPFGVGQTVTHGIVSATDRGGMGIEDFESFIQTDAPINPGNSGGALVDVTGHLIGINTAILSRSGGSLGIGFAVPSELAGRVMRDLVKYGYVVRGYLGVETQDLTPELAKEFSLKRATGALVAGVVPKGPAEMAGLKAGDVITRFGGEEVRDPRQLRFSVAEAKPCQTVPVEVLRNGSAKPLRVILGEAPSNEPLLKADLSPDQQDPGALQGVTIIELSSQVRRHLQIPRHVQGAVVLDLRAYSAAAQAGLRPGDVIQSVNRHEVGNAEEASQLAHDADKKRMLLRVWSSSGSHFILIEG